MAKILGLDLGTNSIGWAVVDAQIESGKVKEYNGIDDTGVRIFPEGVVDKGTAKEISKNATRTEKRQTRRQFYRKRMRKIKLLQVLINEQMCPLTYQELNEWKNWDKIKKAEGRKFPNSTRFKEWLALNPYLLRAKALEQEVSLEELGRILYHMIQRRGFLSGRKVKEDGTIFSKGKPDENILPINLTKNKIQNSTLGKYLYSIYPEENKPYKRIYDENNCDIRVRGRYTIRDMYVEEFEKIWQYQSKYKNLDKIHVDFKKTRELRGNINNKRNQDKINKLKEKYGDNNVDIHNNIITTCKKTPFKELLVGNIWYERDEEGNKTIKFKSNESTLFWQRPLKSQKQYLSDCRFETNMPVIKENGDFLRNAKGEIQTRGKKPCPISHPEFELFRAHQFINNITYGKNHYLTPEQKIVVLDLINSQETNFDFVKIPQKLNLSYEIFNYDDKSKVAGNYTHKKLKPLFTKEQWEQNKNDIWHCFYFYDDTDMLFQKLSRSFNFSGTKEDIRKIKLKDDYASVSLRAIRNILPYLVKGYHYDRAVILGGVKNAFGKRWERFTVIDNQKEKIEREIISILKEKNKEGEAIEKIKQHLVDNQYGFVVNDPYFTRLYHHSHTIEEKKLLETVPLVENLRNPIVQQALYETRRLVNSLIEKYKKEEGESFKFDKIHIEMGRDLRQSKQNRLEATYRNNENNDKNNEARERLAEYGLRPSRENIHKYLMYKEIEERAGLVRCPYTGKPISVALLLGRDNAIQIEHIIPYSVSLDDSFANKTLCEAHFNKAKGEKTPYQFYQENSDPKLWGLSSWDEVKERAFRILPYAKAKRFVSEKAFATNDFIERQLNDSRYIAKKAVELLSSVCKDVRAFPGQLTAQLRHLWGINNVLTPICNISSSNFEVNEHKRIPYYVIIDNETKEIVSIERKFNEKPNRNLQELFLPINILKGKIITDAYKINFNVPELEDGKYWAKLLLDSNVFLVPKYIAKPNVDEDSIVLKGRIDKGIFKNDTLRKKIKTEKKDGYYWATIKITNTSIEEPKKNIQPKVKNNQILLYGSVNNGVFKCYIYSCKSDLPDGKYWIILDIDIDQITFTRAFNEIPETNQNQIALTTTVDENAKAIIDIDKEFMFDTEKSAGKYYAILSIKSVEDYYKIENNIPDIKKGEKLIEGDVWLDKYTGEIKFDPKKNREDHRHHAIDAMVIALTQQSYLQRLSTHNAQRKDKHRELIDSTEKFPLPWVSFVSDVQQKAEGILVSYKQNRKILTKNKKGFSVRGSLHKETVYGKRMAPLSEQRFHVRKKITAIENEKDVAKIVDITIAELIRKHLKENCEIDVSQPYKIPKDAFYKDGKWRLHLPNKRGETVPIKKIRIKEVIGNAVQLKSDINQYVNPRNNHHVIIYKDEEGNLNEQVVQFWEVVERMRNNEAVYQLPDKPKDKAAPKEIITILQENDMFILGLSDDELQDNKNNHGFLSHYLYKVQKIAGGSYFMEFCFRKQNDSRRDSDAKRDYVYIKNFGTGVTGWYTYNPRKIIINTLGKIQAIK